MCNLVLSTFISILLIEIYITSHICPAVLSGQVVDLSLWASLGFLSEAGPPWLLLGVLERPVGESAKLTNDATLAEPHMCFCNIKVLYVK